MTIWSLYAAISGFLAIILGAVGDHMMRALPSASIYHTALQYQMWHTLLLFMLGLYIKQYKQAKYLKLVAWLCLLGIILFSGSIYLNLLTKVTWFSWLTPIGGFCLMLTWLCLALAVIKNYSVSASDL
jgi:uncharacterized membrane protein YgdD (TMEM256/DUF423 family)